MVTGGGGDHRQSGTWGEGAIAFGQRRGPPVEFHPHMQPGDDDIGQHYQPGGAEQQPGGAVPAHGGEQAEQYDDTVGPALPQT